jgi:DAACS family dicarboxylate/amino acid:cation (Na+ or H+) symporter
MRSSNEVTPSQADVPADTAPSAHKKRHTPLYIRALIGVALGIVFGAVFKTNEILFGIRNADLGTLGMMVIKLLRALAVPLVLFAILDAFAKTRISAKAGGRLVLICLVNVSVAMLIGLTIMNTLKPGLTWTNHLDQIRVAVNPEPIKAGKSDDPDAPGATLALLPNIDYYVPKSLIRPLVYNNLISVVLMAVLFGCALRSVQDRQQKTGETSIRSVVGLIEGIYQILLQALDWIVQTVPIAVFGIVAKVVGGAGVGVFSVLGIFLGTTLLGLAIHALIYYPLVAWFWGRKPPRIYLGKGADAIVTGLSVNSSLATVPITLRCLEKMGVSTASARLAACVGTNLNNDGITLYEAMAALFLAQAVGMNLTLGQQLVVVLASIMAGAGVAGIPEAGLIVLPLVLGAAGLPEEIIVIALPLLLPVDWIVARARSGVNVMSDMLVAILLDRMGGAKENEVPAIDTV